MPTLDTSVRAARSINRQGKRQAQQLCISMFFGKRDVCSGKSHEVVKQLDQEEQELGLTQGGVLVNHHITSKRHFKRLSPIQAEIGKNGIPFSSMSFCQPIFTNTKHVGDLLM